MKILVFDKYLGYQVGGAQNSLHALLKELKGDFELIGCNAQKSFSAEKYKLSNWEVERVKIREFPKFPYLEYWFNRNRIKKFISSQKADLLITQGICGSLAIEVFNGRSIYFIRDEYHFNQVPIYYKGIKGFLKKIYILFQWPFIKQSFIDNTRAMKRADLVIANSKFMARKLEELFKRSVEFVYPLMDLKRFLQIQTASLKERKYLTLIGSEVIKGRDVAERIAAVMPDHDFMIVGREFQSPIQKGNILYQPWSTDPLEIYKKSKIVLSTTIIDSAIPRTGRIGPESNALGIPCIGSRVNSVQDYLHDEFYVEDRNNINSWKEKILEIEKKLNQLPAYLKEKASEYELDGQVAKFKKIVKDKLGFNL